MPPLYADSRFIVFLYCTVFSSCYRQILIQPKAKQMQQISKPPSLFRLILINITFLILLFVGTINKIFLPSKRAKEKNREGYPSLRDEFLSFFINYMYRRVRDCWNYPICGVPGHEVVLKERITKDMGWTFE